MEGEGQRERLELLSWDLASRLFLRNVESLRLIRAFPGGGQHDVLWLFGDQMQPDIKLNRAMGTIQVHGTVGGRPAPEWRPTPWSDFERADVDGFVTDLERAAGLTGDRRRTTPTPESLTYLVIAAVIRQAFNAGQPLEASMGFIDTSGYGGGEDQILRSLGFAPELFEPRPTDLFEEPGYRFWLLRDREGVRLAFEQSSATVLFVDQARTASLEALSRQFAGVLQLDGRASATDSAGDLDTRIAGAIASALLL